MERKHLVIVAGAFLLSIPAFTQNPAPPPNSFVGLATSMSKKFEVATVKRSDAEAKGGRLGPPGRGSISIVNLPLRNIIIQSFRTQRTMVFGGPDWIEDERYDIVGKGPDPTVGNPEVWEMMRSLLAERFQLKYHIEDREIPVFALTVAKGGPKLKAGETGRCAEQVKAGQNCGDILVPPFGVAMYNMPIGALVTSLAGKVPRPIVEKTGLTGKYDVNVAWLPDGVKLEDLAAVLPTIPAEYRPEDVSLFEALEKQAGLKLEPQRASMPVLIIDRVEHPSEN